MTKYRHALGQVLREMRADRGLTLRDVSSKASIALGYLSEVERGQKEISSELLASLAVAFDCGVHELVIAAGYRLGLDHGYLDSAIPQLEYAH